MRNYKKRKTRTTGSSGDEEKEDTVFASSKKVIRSPTFKPYTAKVSEIKEPGEEMGDLSEIKTMMSEMMQELKRNNEEIRPLREELKNIEEKWDIEKKELLGRVQKLEVKLETNEKEKRKLNLIIKGVKTDGKDTAIFIENFVKEKLGVETTIKKAYHLNKERNITLVQIESWEKKQAVIGMKYKLKGSQVFVEHDLTQEEREVQQETQLMSRKKMQLTKFKQHSLKKLQRRKKEKKLI